MTDRIKGCAVVFERDLRDDDAAAILDAITMLKGVLSVQPSVTECADWMNRTRVYREIRDKLDRALEDSEFRG